MKLLIDPFLQAHFADAFYISRPRPVPQAVHCMHNCFVFGQLGDGKLSFEFLVEVRRGGILSGKRARNAGDADPIIARFGIWNTNGKNSSCHKCQA